MEVIFRKKKEVINKIKGSVTAGEITRATDPATNVAVMTVKKSTVQG
jgi:hypothetical protein